MRGKFKREREREKKRERKVEEILETEQNKIEHKLFSLQASITFYVRNVPDITLTEPDGFLNDQQHPLQS